VIVVDDCSDDGGLQVAEELASQFPDLVKVVALDENGGPTKARNAGAKIAAGFYYFFLDSDTRMFPDTLERFSHRIPDADAVSGIYHFEPLNDEACARYKAILTYYMFAREGVVEYQVFLGSAAGVRASLYHELGGYNESLSWGMDYENEEFGLRLTENHRLLMDPSVTVQHTFPGFFKVTNLYFLRVSLWVELFMRHRRFESAGPATGDTGIGTLAVPCAIAASLLGLWYPIGWAVAILFWAIYLYAYSGFLLFILRRRPSFFPMGLILNLYFSMVISLASVYGACRHIVGGRVGRVLGLPPS